MKKTYKKIKSTAPTSDKKLSTSDKKNKPSMQIKISSTKKNQKFNEKESKEELTISFTITKDNIIDLESNLNKLKTEIDIERNNSMKDATELNKKLKELNNDINRLENNNKYLTNNINNQKKLIRNYKNALNVKKNSEKDNNIDKLNKKIKLNQNMISNNKLNLKLLKKEKNFLEKEIKENDIPDQKENLEKQLEDIFKSEIDIKKEIEKLTIIKNEHDIVCKRKQKEHNKKIEIIKREIEYEQKKKEIFDKYVNDKEQNNNKKNSKKLNNITDININIKNDINKSSDIQGIKRNDSSDVKNKNIFNKNSMINNGPNKNIFNFYLRQFNENRNKKRKEKFELKKILNSNITNINNNNDIRSFSSLNNESNNNNDILNIKSINNKSNSIDKKQNVNRTLFTKSEKALLLKLIPDKCLDNYENKYDLIMKENLSLQSKLNDKIKLKTIKKQNNLIKLENSELIKNVYYKQKLKLDTEINKSNKKKFEINDKIKKNKKLLDYYDSIFNQKKSEYTKLLNNYKNIYEQIKKGNLMLKKGAQLTQDNILCMDKYGKNNGDNSSINDINDDFEQGKISDNFEESENNENIDENENENNNESINEDKEDEKN